MIINNIVIIIIIIITAYIIIILIAFILFSTYNIEFEQNKKQYEILYTDVNFQYDDSHGSFSTTSRHHQGGMVKDVKSSKEVYYISIEHKFHNGSIISFIIYLKGQKNRDFKKNFNEDLIRRLDDNISRRIYHLDWSKVYDKDRNLNNRLIKIDKNLIRN